MGRGALFLVCRGVRGATRGAGLFSTVFMSGRAVFEETRGGRVCPPDLKPALKLLYEGRPQTFVTNFVKDGNNPRQCSIFACGRPLREAAATNMSRVHRARHARPYDRVRMGSHAP